MFNGYPSKHLDRWNHLNKEGVAVSNTPAAADPDVLTRIVTTPHVSHVTISAEEPREFDLTINGKTRTVRMGAFTTTIWRTEPPEPYLLDDTDGTNRQTPSGNGDKPDLYPITSFGESVQDSLQRALDALLSVMDDNNDSETVVRNS